MIGNIIVPTKLHRPPVPKEWVDRPRLVKRLNEGFLGGRQVTLVSAPAGFGKSTCVSRWIELLETVPAAWLSLDPSDNDPGCFFPCFLAALQTVYESIGLDLRGIFAAGEIPPAERIAAALAGDMLSFEKPFIIVLDDLHFIQDPLIYRALEILIHTPPPQLRMVFITREDPPLPIARLRANGGLTEIRGEDLRLNREETRSFLNGSLKLSLTEQDIDVLKMKTEGWAAGLKLASLALQTLPFGQDNVRQSEFIASLSGRHHYIAKYLTEQVLSRLPPERREFLLQTAILDTMNPRVCGAVTGRQDSRMILQRLSTENLFIIPLDDQGSSYRYHQLFSDLLRELGTNLLTVPVEELHRRACGWYRAAAIPESAIEHALKGGDYPAALELLENHAMDIIMRGHVKTLDSWVRSLPREKIIHSPRINLAFAWMYVLRGDSAGAEPYMELLESMFSSPAKEEENASAGNSEIAEWLVIRSLLSYAQGTLTDALDLADKALETACMEDHRVLSMAHYARASACGSLGKRQEAENEYRAALKSAAAAPNQIAELLSTAGLCVNAFEHGRLHRSAEIILPAIERLEKSPSQPSMSCVIYGAIAEIYYQWNRREEARQLMLKALRLSTLGGYAGKIGCRILLSRLELLEGHREKAAIYIREAMDFMEDDSPAFLIQEAAAQQVHCYLAAGDPREAALVLEPFGFRYREGFHYPVPDDTMEMGYSEALLYNSSLHLLIYLAENRRENGLLKEGLDLAETLITSALRNRSDLTAIESLLLRARLKTAAEKGTVPPGAEDDIIRALELGQAEDVYALFGEQKGIVITFLNEPARRRLPNKLSRKYIKTLTASFTAAKTSAEKTVSDLPFQDAPGKRPEDREMAEELTGRELEILRCMSTGMKYREIADTLYISLNTVRFHVKSIYGKMAVDNRTKALEKARRFGFLQAF